MALFPQYHSSGAKHFAGEPGSVNPLWWTSGSGQDGGRRIDRIEKEFSDQFLLLVGSSILI